MWLPVVLVVSFWHSAHAEVCVLESMVTKSHTKCQPPTTCTVNYFSLSKDVALARFYVPLKPLKHGTSAFSHFQSVRATDKESFPEDIFTENSTEWTLSSVPVTACPNVASNASSKYRTFDGSNNNVNHTEWGRANTTMIRLVVPRYSGSGGKVAVSVTGTELPNARVLSYSIFPDVDKPSVNCTLAVMQWGQLMAHDVGLSPNPGNDCCTDTGAFSSRCMAINLPADDPFYSQFNQTCLNMMRSDHEQRTFGCLQFPDQISSVSQIIDLSLVYGSDSTTAQDLRQCQGGLLQISTGARKREFLPLSYNSAVDCNAESRNEACFRAGDIRVNQNTQLTCLQVVLLREHNRIAKALAAINPQWNDERLYQETRAILIAMFQHISYNDFLPLMLGEDAMQKYHLYPLQSGYSYSYNATVDPSTINSFMTGAYRVFHSTIQGRLQLINTSTRCPYASLNISDWMLRPGIIVPDYNLDELLLGLTVEPIQQNDRFFTTQMTEMMFHNNMSYGEDLESFDIQRGRDHGIPAYNTMRELCNLPRAKNFSDLVPDMGEKHVKLLARAYAHVDDIDYFVGGTLETQVVGASVGPTFLCILTEQFVRKKIGDRFWYENANQLHSFSKAQLQEIRKASLSRLLCDNGDNISQMQPNAFLFASKYRNGVVPCSYLPALNLTAWKES